jgi:hypothetical protein
VIAAKDNPFATERVEALLPYEPEWIGQSWAAIDAAFARHDRRGAVVGPHGSGKTTFLETLARRLRESGEDVAPLFINRQRRSIAPAYFTALTDRTIILFDGAEQLGPIAWRRFLNRTRHTRGLIVTAHRISRLPTLFETDASPTVLQRCIERLDPEFTAGKSDALFDRHRGNLRHALLECYDLSGA